MEIFTYLLKSSSLIAVFYLAYYFLVRKETFFNSNRWFLLAGLFTSVLMPLWFFKKIIIVEKPKFNLQDFEKISQQSLNHIVTAENISKIDWTQLLYIGYILVCMVLLLKILSDLVSLFLLLKNKLTVDNKQFKLVDLKQNIGPFSFFKYIVYNSSLYSTTELESILSHEKVHCEEQHSVDVLVAKLFCVFFWFNPFVWLYKNAMIQNLEFIADKKAIQNIEDKKAYQMTLLRVVTDQNCLTITNLFHQPDLPKGESLIKKRIVMLNKNQSQRKNALKYALVVPVLVAFMLLFQVKVVAQEKELKISKQDTINKIVTFVYEKSTDEEIRKSPKLFKEVYNIDYKISNVKRNTKGEIINIKVEFDDHNGGKGVNEQKGNKPIKQVNFIAGVDEKGKMYTKFYQGEQHYEETYGDRAVSVVNVSKVEMLEAIEKLEVPEPPMPPNPDVEEVIVKTIDIKPTIIIDGKVQEDDFEISEIDNKKVELMMVYKGENAVKKFGENGKNGLIVITTKDNKSNIKLKPNDEEVDRILKERRQILIVSRENARKVRAESLENIEQSKAEMEKSKAEMQAMKAEMLKAKAEMEQAKAEMEKAKAELQKQSK
jgi:hypothetical protein